MNKERDDSTAFRGTPISRRQAIKVAAGAAGAAALGRRGFGWSPTPVKAAGWGQTWIPLNNPTVTYGPAAVSWGRGRVDIVAVRSDGVLIHASSNDGENYSDWEDPFGNYYGTWTSSPAVTSWQPGRLDVFVRGSDGAVWTTRYLYGWGNMHNSWGGNIQYSPSAISDGPGRLAVFAVGTGGSLFERFYDANGAGLQDSWQPHGGTWTGAPAAVAQGYQNADVYIVGRNQRLWSQRGTVAGWTAFNQMWPDQTSPKIAVTSWGPGRIDLFVLGYQTGNLYHRSFQGGWTPWENLGGSWVDGPAAVSWQGVVKVFVVDSNGQMFAKYYQ